MSMSRKDKVTIITNGYFPVPAVMGGAVEALVENIIQQNELLGKLDLNIISCYDEQAYKIAKKYGETKVEFVKIPCWIKSLDQFCYFMVSHLFKKKDGLSFKCKFQRMYYVYKVGSMVNKKDYGKLVLENHPVLFRILKYKQNAKKYEGRYYFHIHNEVTKAHGCAQIMANCKKVLGVSSYINQTFRTFLNHQLDGNTYAVLRNRINRNKFLVGISEERKKQLKEKYGLADDDIILLFTGRFSPEKGVRELLEAFKQITNPKVKLLVVGGFFFGSGVTSSFETEIRTLSESVKDQVRFTGYVDYANIPEYYGIADIVVVPSIWDDPAPLTVIESMTCGKPLITTYSGGIPEYADQEHAILLKRDATMVNCLADAIMLLAENPLKRRTMEKNAINKTKNWTIESYYEDFCMLVSDES